VAVTLFTFRAWDQDVEDTIFVEERRRGLGGGVLRGGVSMRSSIGPHLVSRRCKYGCGGGSLSTAVEQCDFRECGHLKGATYCSRNEADRMLGWLLLWPPIDFRAFALWCVGTRKTVGIVASSTVWCSVGRRCNIFGV